MAKLTVSSGELIGVLTGKFGFRFKNQKDSKVTLTKGKTSVVIPDHKEINEQSVVKILEEAEIEADKFWKKV